MYVCTNIHWDWDAKCLVFYVGTVYGTPVNLAYAYMYLLNVMSDKPAIFMITVHP